MANRSSTQQFLVCVKNQDYPASLEVRKIYRTLPDATALAKGFVRVVDESDEDYLYPADYFIAIDLPKATVDALLAAS
jgi:hypothetical protein